MFVSVVIRLVISESYAKEANRPPVLEGQAAFFVYDVV